MIRIAVPDLVSISYFPIIAAVEMGFFKAEGLDASVDLLFPIPKTFEALRDGQLDFVVGSAHATLLAFPDWNGAKLLCAIGQHTYWFLVVRSDLNAKRGVIVVASSQNLAVPKLYPPLILGDEQMAEFAEKAEDTLKTLP